MNIFYKYIIFKEKQIRRTWYNSQWWFSVVDVCGALTESADTGAFLRKLKQRLKEEGSEVVTNCHELRLEAPDEKMRETDCANTEGIFRIIQSISSPKAEPFKKWLAQVGYERIKRMIDKRLRGIAIRQNLTDEWQERSISSEKRLHNFNCRQMAQKSFTFRAICN